MAKTKSLAELEAQQVKNRQEKQRIDAQMRAAERQETHKRRLHWGTVLDKLGILDLPESTIIDALKFAYAVVTDGHDPDGTQHVIQLAGVPQGPGQDIPDDDELEAFLDGHPNNAPSQLLP
jgi:uncharacterized protein YceK